MLAFSASNCSRWCWQNVWSKSASGSEQRGWSPHAPDVDDHVGLPLGAVLGDRDGDRDGTALGDVVGLIDGLVVGLALGLRDGLAEGDELGDADGAALGLAEGVPDGDELGARGLVAADVLAAIQREHVEVPGGALESERIEYLVRTDAEFRTVEELESLIVAHVGGAPVLLRDVARIEDGAEDLDMEMHYNGVEAVGIGIMRQSGGNTVAIVDEVYRRADLLEPSDETSGRLGRVRG